MFHTQKYIIKYEYTNLPTLPLVLLLHIPHKAHIDPSKIGPLILIPS
jgi:hypothetical protein